MTMKSALMRLPYGGAKGGVKVASSALSRAELMRLTRRFTTALGDLIGPDRDIPGPDVGTNAQIMDWMMDTYVNTHEERGRSAVMHVVTGKSVACHGSEGREQATGQGLVYVLQELLPEYGLEIQGLRFSLLGYGNVGANVAALLQGLGARLVAVLDHTGGLAAEEDAALDAIALAEHVRTHGCVKGFAGPQVRDVSREDFYRTPVDLFIPAALERMVDLEVAGWLNCKVLAEGGNGPVTPQADALLNRCGIHILPAILCNAGGVTVSYFEWVQNKAGVRWSLERVNHDLKNVILNAARRVRLASHQHGVSLSTAAYVVAIDYIAKAYLQRGIFP
jgi:glutamate dehydrogenase (NAD(P)+)